MFKKMKEAIKNKFSHVENALMATGHEMLDGTKAEAYVDTGVKILIAVVIGALLLVGLTFLFKDTIFPSVENSVNGMFDKADAGIANIDINI